MKGYPFARSAYRCVDRVLLRRLPPRAEGWVRGRILALARRGYGEHIQARSAAELAADSRSRNSPERLPAWATQEIAALAEFEPELRHLLTPDAGVVFYSIPWDNVHLGEAYADARRRLQPAYACMLLAGTGDAARAAAYLEAAARPAAVLDVDGDPALRAVANTGNADYLPLVKSFFDPNDRAALLTRLVLQLHPRDVRCSDNPFIDQCLARHGLAMRSVSNVLPLAGAVVPSTDAPPGPVPGH